MATEKSSTARLPFETTSRTANATVQRLTDCVVVITEGEIDAANADSFAAFALAQIAGSKPLIVDLTALDFFGTAGFTALHTMNVQCAADGSRWAVAASEAVGRVLRICDPSGALPVAGSLSGAKELVEGDEVRLLQLVPEPG